MRSPTIEKQQIAAASTAVAKSNLVSNTVGTDTVQPPMFPKLIYLIPKIVRQTKQKNCNYHRFQIFRIVICISG
jgi:hypothetical protein